jgi:hypothetical protein
LQKRQTPEKGSAFFENCRYALSDISLVFEVDNISSYCKYLQAVLMICARSARTSLTKLSKEKLNSMTVHKNKDFDKPEFVTLKFAVK